MLTFTLDTNCLIAVDESRPEAAFVQELTNAHKSGIASVGLVAISASERQKAGGYIKNFTEFKERVTKLGLGELELLAPMGYFDITFFDFSLFCDDESMERLERNIHQILFPQIPFLWANYCAANSLDLQADHRDKKWRNAKCDVQAFWSHAYRKRNVFVTSDMNFHAREKRQQLVTLAGGRIETPKSATELLELERITGNPL